MSSEIQQKEFDTIVDNVLIHLEDRIVYCDRIVGETLAFTSGFEILIEEKALTISGLADSELSKARLEFIRGLRGDQGPLKAAIFLSSFDEEKHVKNAILELGIRDIVIFCTMPEPLSAKIETYTYEEFASKVHMWIQESMELEARSKETTTESEDVEPSVQMFYLPLHAISLHPNLFVLQTPPAVDQPFPLQQHDLELALQSGVSVRALSDLEISMLPTTEQRSFHELSHRLSALLSELKCDIEVWSMGHTANQLARDVHSQCAASNTSPQQTKTSLVIIDRTLELASPSVRSDNLMDRIQSLLPLRDHQPQSVDRAVDSSQTLGPFVAPLLPFSLAHPQKPDLETVLGALVTKGPQEALSVVRDVLLHVLTCEKLDVPQALELTGPTVSISQLTEFASFLQSSHPQLCARNHSLFECISALSPLLSSEQTWEVKRGVERSVLWELQERPADGLKSVIDLLAPREHKRETDLSLQDILSLCLACYSLAGGATAQSAQSPSNAATAPSLSGLLTSRLTTSPFLQEDEHKLINLLVPLVAKEGGLTEESEARKKVGDFMERLRGAASSRKHLKHLKNVLQTRRSDGTSSAFRSLVSEVAQRIATDDAVVYEDMQHIASITKKITTGLRSLLFSSQPRATDNSLIVFFVVGGITCSEARDVMNCFATRTKKVKVIVGSTSISTQSETLKRALGYEESKS